MNVLRFDVNFCGTESRILSFFNLYQCRVTLKCMYTAALYLKEVI